MLYMYLLVAMQYPVINSFWIVIGVLNFQSVPKQASSSSLDLTDCLSVVEPNGVGGLVTAATSPSSKETSLPCDNDVIVVDVTNQKESPVSPNQEDSNVCTTFILCHYNYLCNCLNCPIYNYFDSLFLAFTHTSTAFVKCWEKEKERRKGKYERSKGIVHRLYTISVYFGIFGKYATKFE